MPSIVLVGLMAAVFCVVIWHAAKVDGWIKALYGAGVIAALVFAELYFKLF
jgi:hypothetical protein